MSILCMRSEPTLELEASLAQHIVSRRETCLRHTLVRVCAPCHATVGWHLFEVGC